MKNNILTKFNNTSFYRKITVICIIVSLIPTLILGSLGFVNIRTLVLDLEKKKVDEVLQQEVGILEGKLNSYLNALNVVLWDNNIKTSLLQSYSTSYDMYILYKETVDSLFLSIRSLNSDIKMVTIYTDAEINPHGEYILPLSNAQMLPWYKSALTSNTPFYTISSDGKTLYLTCRMYYSFEAPTSVVCVSIHTGQAFESVDLLSVNGYGFLISDQNGTVIYGNEAESVNEILSGDAQSFFMIEQRIINDSEWTVYLYRPMSDQLRASRQFTAAAFLVILLSISICLFFSSTLSGFVTSPLNELAKDMEEVEHGNYDIQISEENNTRNDEIGGLVRAFQAMVLQLNHLINEVLVGKINQQKYELKILQSQINPHFLYNSLSLINSRAIMSGEEEISQIAQLLSSFYRTTLNKGKSITTVQSELENTKSYIAIQQIMHSNSFTVNFDIDSQTLSCYIPNLILQPLAENAILHGLDHRESPGPKVLTVSCKMVDDNIEFKVIDNGCGMEEYLCREILTEESKGYGVKNVHQRIQLYYGQKYGLQYRSSLGCGTCATLRLPTQKPHDLWF